MALDTIHVFADAEVVTHTNLNSIGEGVSGEIGSGNISASSLVWPLVALGNLDMNGYSVINNAETDGVLHVNSTQTLATAVAAVNSAPGGTIMLESGFEASASDLIVSADNVTIMANSPDTIINVPAGITSYGISFTGGNCKIKGVKFTGGVTGKPLINVTNIYNFGLDGCTFLNNAGPSVTVGAGGSPAYLPSFRNCIFTGASESSIYLYDADMFEISGCQFLNNSGHDIQLASDEANGGTANGVIINNLFKGGHSYCIYGDYTGSIGGTRAYINVIGNVFQNDTVAAIDVAGYYSCNFAGNQFMDDVILTLHRATISGNSFNSTSTHECLGTLFTGNYFHGTITFPKTYASNVYTGNWFAQAAEISGDDVISFVGNVGANSFTLDTTEPAVFGLNWGMS